MTCGSNSALLILSAKMNEEKMKIFLQVEEKNVCCVFQKKLHESILLWRNIVEIKF